MAIEKGESIIRNTKQYNMFCHVIDTGLTGTYPFVGY